MAARATWQVRARMAPTSALVVGFSSVKTLRVL
jgi:hypothetical protein